MAGLILFGLLLALFLGFFALSISVGFAWIANRVFPTASVRMLAAMTSGLLPVGLLVWTVISFVPNGCCESGPEAQGLLIMMVVIAALLGIAWLVGHKINLAIIERSSV